MPDAQRRDKLPLMNGPTANSWPSATRIRRRQGAEGRGQKKINGEKERESLARLRQSLALSPNLIEFFLRFLSPPFALTIYRTPRIQIRDTAGKGRSLRIIVQFGKLL